MALRKATISGRKISSEEPLEVVVADEPRVCTDFNKCNILNEQVRAGAMDQEEAAHYQQDICKSSPDSCTFGRYE
jgi:hypothetical protein